MSQAKIYVGNLSYQTTSEELQDLFGEFGSITELKLIIDRETNRSKGFGFITYEDNGAAQQACEKMNGTDLGGRQLKVSPAKESGGGGGGGRRGGGHGGGNGGGGRGGNGGDRYNR
ncbi:MAG: RNA-binding protein [Coxiellaceae bacterium]|nr:RNA-binding protein [Coxiellaceae bacterium]